MNQTKKSGVQIKENLEAIRKLQNGIQFAKHTDVLVGIPREKNAAHDGGVTNAELLYIHTYGSPVRRIPPRPTIAPGIISRKETIRKHMKSALSSAVTGDISNAEAELNKAGTEGENGAKSMFGSSNLTPNAPATVAKKGSSVPLIDTGSLRNSITHVIRKK